MLDLSRYQSLMSSFSAKVHTAKSSHFHNKINSAPDMRKTRSISGQFSPPHTQDPQPTTSTAKTPIFSFCPLTEAEVSKLLSNHPTTCPLDPIPSHLLQATHPTLQASSPLRSSRLRTTNWTLNSQVSGVAIQLRLRYSRSLKPCELQKPIPNHQSSFCWICLLFFYTVNHQILLSTLSSLGITRIPLHWFESYLTGRSWPGEGRYPKPMDWSLGFLRDRFLDPSSSHTLHHWVPSYRHMDSPTIATLMTHSVPGGHLDMDERTSPTAQPGKD
ncbi:uncharacterized protein LOC131537111 isoform X2 [Onychostoma macrolepis]|uniref:uncharacterized protein LOC131537111 isoform X2 n=1 Tax=Onychostoma macrolepis TaxID=369639 RepID=UPI00272A3C34|nr:uncharacterized protein LOC131537111 isoform X2 [Onychostoma macrolepis]